MAVCTLNFASLLGTRWHSARTETMETQSLLEVDGAACAADVRCCYSGKQLTMPLV